MIKKRIGSGDPMRFLYTSTTPGATGFSAAAAFEFRAALAFFSRFLVGNEQLHDKPQHRYYHDQKYQDIHVIPPFSLSILNIPAAATISAMSTASAAVRTTDALDALFPLLVDIPGGCTHDQAHHQQYDHICHRFLLRLVLANSSFEKLPMSPIGSFLFIRFQWILPAVCQCCSVHPSRRSHSRPGAGTPP